MTSCIDPVVKSHSTLLLPAILTTKGIISGNYIIHQIFLVRVPPWPINSLYMRYILECIIWYIGSFESQYERLPRHLKHPLVRTARKQNRRWDENLRDNFQPIPLQTIANMLDWIDLWSNIIKWSNLTILKWRTSFIFVRRRYVLSDAYYIRFHWWKHVCEGLN